ncbi:2-oxoacid:acceptor oxidoreductase subunit alpha [Candidatus Gottesmanbacteria bacterium]|nr:2-oxoacid:acceptor oxidoreductase subunit alpha [Candidatus Gottesmanbacteria bacterium]
MAHSITWKIGGEAGFGIMASGTMLAKAFARHGYFVFTLNEYPSLIRGGHNAVTVRIATEPFDSLDRSLHVLVALNKESVEVHKKELTEGTVLLYDPNDYPWKREELPSGVMLIPLPFREIVQKHAGDVIMRNTVALGASIAIMGAPFEYLADVIRDQFVRKGEAVVNHNIDIARAGYDAAGESVVSLSALKLDPVDQPTDYLLMNGSEAVGLGAVRAGLKFAAIYPMTPINALITFLADHAKSLGVVYKQPEDEIAGINMAIGASIAGVRSMVATSGGGFALMVEGLSLAGMIEVPLVIDMGMRVGPATGMPTWTEQGELGFLIHAGHGEFARIILTPADATQAYDLTIKAFNLAEQFHVPVFVLTDKYLNESQWCVEASLLKGEVHIDRGKVIPEARGPSETGFKRYDLSSPDGVSARSFPGMKGGQYMANSYEHDETGLVSEDAAMRKAMVDRRLRKIDAIKKVIMPPAVYGNAASETAIVTWGSTLGPVLEAVKDSARIIHFPWLYPFPSEQTKTLLSGAGRIIDVEQNATGQLASLIREHTGIEVTEKVLKYDGRPFLPEEIVERIKI